jgi:hypothetical protein
MDACAGTVPIGVGSWRCEVVGEQTRRGELVAGRSSLQSSGPAGSSAVTAITDPEKVYHPPLHGTQRRTINA